MGGRDLGRPLRLLSANLWNGAADPAAFAGLVESLEADVVAVQELSPEQAEALADVLPHGQLDPSRTHLGMGIAMRCPGKIARVSMPLRDAHTVMLHPGDWPELPEPIEVVNVHIAAPHVSPLLSGFVKRRRQMRALLDYLTSTWDRSPRALLGDFNATPIWPVYRRISSHLTDAAVAAAQQRGRPVSATWGPGPAWPRMLRIDHGFVRGLRVEDFQVVPLPDSDHSAIVMDLSPELAQGLPADAGGRAAYDGSAHPPARGADPSDRR